MRLCVKCVAGRARTGEEGNARSDAARGAQETEMERTPACTRGTVCMRVRARVCTNSASRRPPTPAHLITACRIGVSNATAKPTPACTRGTVCMRVRARVCTNSAR